MRRRGQKQLELPVTDGWGGKRAGAGRTLVAARPSPPHHPRPPHEARWPVHITLRAVDALPSLRSLRVFTALRHALAAAHKRDFRVVHFSVQSDHLHLVVEGDSRVALTRGLQGLAGRCARAINRAAGRTGRVWNMRYHAHALRTPTEARRGLVYVLLNFRKHLRAPPGIDPRSSGVWFEGWQRVQPPAAAASPLVPPAVPASPVAPARTWLAAVGWRRAGGAIDLEERPGPTQSRPFQDK
jgi:REP element-mobilizing transposase RayT